MSAKRIFNKRSSTSQAGQGSINHLANDISLLSKDIRSDTILALVRTADMVNAYWDTKLKSHSNSRRAGFSILNTLVTHGGSMTQTELSKLVFRSKYSITKAVDILEKSGLVERRLVYSDRRVRQVKITKEGIRTMEKTLPLRRQMLDEVTSCLSEEKVKELGVILHELRKYLLSPQTAVQLGLPPPK